MLFISSLISFRNRIHFSDNITNKKHCHKGEHNLRYNLNICKKKRAFYIRNEISENISLMQLMDTLGNMNHAISILRSWVFHCYYEKSLFLEIESLNLIFSSSVGEEQVATFEAFFYAVRYMRSPGNTEKG